MSDLRCVGTPVSWLRLEQHALGELAASEASAIEEHLEACPACRACAEECTTAVALPELQLPGPGAAQASTSHRRDPLALHTETPATRAGAPETGSSHLRLVSNDTEAVTARSELPPARRRGGRARRRWIAPVSLGVAAAAAVLLMLQKPNPRTPERGVVVRVEPAPPATNPVGAMDAATPVADVRLTLLREREGRVVEAPTRFLPSDRLAVRLTCRPGTDTNYRVAVFQSGRWSAPFADVGHEVRCGNRVRIPGAFRLSEATPASVCIVWGRSATKVESVGDTPPLPAELLEASCRHLTPVEAFPTE